MRPQTGDRDVSILAGHFELHVAVELIEADVTADLGFRRPEEPA